MIAFSARIKSFMSKYKIRHLSSSKRCVRTIPNLEYFANPDDKDTIHSHAPTFDSEPMITLDIPLSQLERIVNIEAMFFNNIDDGYPRNLFQRWVEQQEEEYALRIKFDAVRKAYEHYSAMLSWCGKAYRKITDLPPEEDNS